MAFHELIPFVALGRSALLVVCALTLGGCAVVGPQSISGGRAAYSEVINNTANEEILNAIVRIRYDQTFGMMSVAAVTASLRFSALAGTNAGIGSSDAYAGNLVPFSAGVAYEENPTISYSPLSGEDFTRRMLGPLSVSELILLSRPSQEPGAMLAVATSSINGLRNALLAGEAPSREFERFLELFGLLKRAGVLDTVEAPEAGKESRYYWDIHDYAGAHDDSVRELLDLLGVEVEPDGSTIFLPVRQAVGTSATEIHIHNRSAWDVLRLLGTGIVIPPAHLEAGVAEPMTIPAEMQYLKVRSSEAHWWDSRPEDATVAIRFRDHWFYISDTDTESKRAFVLVSTLIGMRLADPGAAGNTPVITVPVN